MRGFSHLLVPIDFSDPSEKILDAGVRVMATGGRITLLHVMEWIPAVLEGGFGVYPHRKDMEAYRQEAQVRLGEYRDRRADLPIEVLLREGRAASTILEVVAELHPDLVVLGSHGRSRLDHLLIGSVTERVVRKAPCPVLVVRC